MDTAKTSPKARMGNRNAAKAECDKIAQITLSARVPRVIKKRYDSEARRRKISVAQLLIALAP